MGTRVPAGQIIKVTMGSADKLDPAGNKPKPTPTPKPSGSDNDDRNTNGSNTDDEDGVVRDNEGTGGN